MPRSIPKNSHFESLTEVQRAWLRTQTARNADALVPISFTTATPKSLYPIMRLDTLQNTSSDWRTHPEVLTKARLRMVAALRKQGIVDEVILTAMGKVPRHVFVDDAFYLRAYDDDALPIGHGQTISQPSTVARMLSLLRMGGGVNKVLEIGTGCGYQAAVLALCASEVHSIERVASLFEIAKINLSTVNAVLPRLPSLSLGDGMKGLAAAAPFDGIVLAAAGMAVPQLLLEQLRVGGVLVAPVVVATASGCQQRLVRIVRINGLQWQREVFDVVHFVPLLSGVQLSPTF